MKNNKFKDYWNSLQYTGSHSITVGKTVATQKTEGYNLVFIDDLEYTKPSRLKPKTKPKNKQH